MERKTYTRICIWLFMIVLTMFSINAIIYTPFWEDTSQPFRTNFNITGGTSSKDNVTTTVNINAALMGSNFDFSDTDDRNSIRIYYYNSTHNYTQASHDVIAWNSGASTGTLQFKAPYLTTGNNQYFIYFGDSTKSNIEDYCSTYIYCDLFNDGSIDSRLSTVDNDGVGGTSFSESGGVLSITAGGADTWTGSDQYGSVYLNNIEGDVEVKLAVISQTAPNVWCKGGIMFKNDMTAAASSTGYVFNVRTPGNGYSFQRDLNNNGYLDSSSTGGSPSVFPSFLRMVKSGTSFTGYYSKTNPSTWTTITTSSVTSTNSDSDIGVSLTSHAGSTTATATFDNLTVERYTSDTYSINNGDDEKLMNFLTFNLTSPSTIVTHNVLQNQTIKVNGTVKCNSYDSSSCLTISNYIQRYNSGFSNVATTSTTPLWSMDSNPQNCVLTAGNSCDVSLEINVTGVKNSQHILRVLSQSSDTDIDNVNSDNISIKIIIGNSVSFNQSIFDFGTITKHLGDKSQSFEITADNGDNTNIIVECESGDCSEFSDNWLDTADLFETNSQDFEISCLDNTLGNHTAVFNVTSDEFDSSSLITVSCEVKTLYGPLSLIQLNPVTQDISVKQNGTFTFQVNASCLGICNTITAYATYLSQDWWDDNWDYRQLINTSTTVNTINDYQILLHLNSSNLGSNFDWSNSCSDVRFAYGNTELDYWIETCDTSGEHLYVWVETNQSLVTTNDYNFYLYYGNSAAIDQSSATDTFRNDEIHLVTGNWVNIAPVSSQYIDDHIDANNLRSTIGSGSFTTHGTGYVSTISHPTNPYGSDEYYYYRARFLFIPSLTRSYGFATASDDGSEIGIWDYDGYGSGIRTPTSVTSGAFSVVGTYYGAHGSGTCGSVGTPGSSSLTSGTGYWIDYLMGEWSGGQDAEMCINDGGGYSILSTSNFPNQIFAREYVTPEPTIDNIGSEEMGIISTVSGDTPLWTTDFQPQTCVLPESGSCLLEWEINATGLINTSYLVNVYASSSNSNVVGNSSAILNVTITDFIIPTVTLISPIDNEKKVFSGNTTLIYQVNDDSVNLNCSLYIDGIFNQTNICSNNGNNSISLDLKSGLYNWSIVANDTDNNIGNSLNWSFIVIKNISKNVEKSIKFENLNQYKIEIIIKDLTSKGIFGTLIEWVSDRLNSGSRTPIENWINITASGEYVGWEEKSSVNHSIAGTPGFKIRNSYVIGLD